MNDLVTIETFTPAVVFAPGGVEAIISKLETEVRAIKTDISSESGRAAIKSLAHKVARSKTALDGMGKELGQDHYDKWKSITSERSVIVSRLDALRDEVRKPLTDWENIEKDRVAGHKAAMETIALCANSIQSQSLEELRTLLVDLDHYAKRDWQEFAALAASEIADTRKRAELAIGNLERQTAEAAELAKLRAEQAAREQVEREARIAAEAAEAARGVAENKAAREAAELARKIEVERLLIEQEKAAAIAWAEKAEAQRKADAERAERQAKDAAEAAERRQAAAIEAERKRVADEAAKAAAETAKREADKAHKAKVNNAAVAALVAGGLTKEAATLAVTLIAKRQVPSVTISY